MMILDRIKSNHLFYSRFIPLLIIFSIISPLNSSNAAKANNVAKIIILRGVAKAKNITGDVRDLKKNDWVAEGAVVQTGPKSFVKLLFIDKSQMNLGPKSKIVINKFPKKNSGIITLMKGSLRSKVTKDYLGQDGEGKSKLFIKTKNAAMGVRGTDFEVNHDPISGITNLDVVSGLVVLAQLEGDFLSSDDFTQEKLEAVVSGPKAVKVSRGLQSEVSPNGKGAAPAKEIPKEKLQELKQDVFPEAAITRHIPPGVTQKMAENDDVAEAAESAELKESVSGRGPASIKTEVSEQEAEATMAIFDDNPFVSEEDAVYEEEESVDNALEEYAESYEDQFSNENQIFDPLEEIAIQPSTTVKFNFTVE